ncbi:MAG: cyclic nucleotide-binding domain-containing protein [Chloroflexi bacterium]|nr:cyclic nucleotide-binding domain-containing protein [Chloroflexota bacterium]
MRASEAGGNSSFGSIALSAAAITLGAAALLLVSLAGYALVVGLLVPMLLLAAGGWFYWTAAGIVRRAQARGTSHRLKRLQIPRQPRYEASASPVVLERLMQRVDIFRGLSAAQVARVEALGRMVHIPADEVMGKAREDGPHIYIIVAGKVELTTRSGLGEVTVRVAEAGESLPLATLLGKGTLITTMTAMTDLEALAVPRESLLRLYQSHPEIGACIYANMAEILAGRYKAALAYFTSSTLRAVAAGELWANV